MNATENLTPIQIGAAVLIVILLSLVVRATTISPVACATVS